MKGHDVASYTRRILLNASMQLVAGLTFMISGTKVLLHLQFQFGVLNC